MLNPLNHSVLLTSVLPGDFPPLRFKCQGDAKAEGESDRCQGARACVSPFRSKFEGRLPAGACNTLGGISVAVLDQ